MAIQKLIYFAPFYIITQAEIFSQFYVVEIVETILTLKVGLLAASLSPQLIGKCFGKEL